MFAVADTSPINYLVWIGLEEILPKLYGTVVVPPEVRDELVVADAPSVVREWASRPPEWVHLQPVDVALRDDPRWIKLDLGERAAIASATVLQPSIFLIDERAGSVLARGIGLPVTGTLGVLEQAALRNIIDLADAIERLKGTSFRYPKILVSRLLEENAGRSRDI